jgi:hypothetical protein
MRTRIGALLLSLLALLSCTTPIWPRGAPVPPQACPGQAAVEEAVFLIGDAGDPDLPPDDTDRLVDPVLLALRRDIATSAAALGDEHVTTVFLGDNAYRDGLPVPGHEDRRDRERKLEAQIAASAPGEAVFTLGNHDWHIEGSEGWDRALAQRQFLQGFAPRVSMRPPGGCAGPDRVDVGEHLRLVFIDLIGFEHAVDHPEVHREACSGRTPLESYYDLAAEFRDTGGAHVGLAMHYPLLTVGPHGGHYTWKQHLFPLTDFWSWAWVPLPLIGSAYPISRQLGVTGTDVVSQEYLRDIQGVFRAASLEQPTFFVAGHEHSLQLHRDFVGAYYLVSGAGSTGKVDRVETDEMDTVMLAEARAGYMRLDVRSDASIELVVTAVDGPGETETLMRHCIADGPAPDRRPARPSYQR